MGTNACSALAILALALGSTAFAQNPGPAPQASYVDSGHSTVRLELDGKAYLVDVAAGTVRPASGSGASAGQSAASQSALGGALFAENCARCHGSDGRGITSTGTPNFTRPDFQAKLTNQQIADTIRNGKSDRMPAFAGQLSDDQVSAL